jgi:hypothetical protein
VNWPVIIIPLIVLGVWILSTVFRTDEERAEQERRNRRGGDGRTRVPRRPQTELDRFLEEARARRRAPAEERKDSPPPAEPFPQPPPVENPRPPAPEVPRQRPPRAPERPPQPRRPAPEPVRRAEPVLVAQPVRPPVTAPPALPVEPVRAPTQESSGTEAPALAAVVTVPPTRPREQPPGVRKLLALLQDRQSLGAAVMLAEVFGRPVGERRRR